MKKKKEKTLKGKVLVKMRSRKGTIVLFSDLVSLGGTCQISRVLKGLVESGLLARLSKGVYAKTEENPYSDRPTILGGFSLACIEALDRLGVRYGPSNAVKRYNERRSEQVPVRFKVRLKSRCRRSISHRGRKLYFEGNVNAR